jgi:hypothetical protein
MTWATVLLLCTWLPASSMQEPPVAKQEQSLTSQYVLGALGNLLIRSGGKADVQSIVENASGVKAEIRFIDFHYQLGSGATKTEKQFTGAGYATFLRRGGEWELTSATLNGDRVRGSVSTGQRVAQLGLAVMFRDATRVRDLLGSGVSARSVFINQRPLLNQLAASGEVELVTLLVQHGADVNAISRSNDLSPLMQAVAAGNPQTVESILKAGAKIDLQNSGGETALMQAAQQGNAPMVQLLISRGAAVNIRSREGKTALGLAKDATVLQLLRKVGAR